MSVAKDRKNAANGSSSRQIVSFGIVVCLLICVVMLYPALRDYYIAARVNQRLLQEYYAVEERNDIIREQIAYLNTDEGIADRARERFGWVPVGEQAVNITGLDVLDSTTVLPAQVPSGSGVAPQTWWTDLLDILFAIEPASPPDPVPDPFLAHT